VARTAVSRSLRSVGMWSAVSAFAFSVIYVVAQVAAALLARFFRRLPVSYEPRASRAT
jgi:hypothetical protein